MTLIEKAKLKNKQLLIESFSFSALPSQIETFAAPKLVESVGGRQFKARGVIRNVDVTRYIENLNSRIYSRKLWEKIKKLGVAEGTYCLTGHPDADGNPIDSCGIWHNFKVGEETSKADLYLIGEAGSHMLEALEAGGNVGFSTVGFGELDESDGKTVIVESYELERLGDWVLQPSQNVYATMENIETQPNKVLEQNKVQESHEKKNINMIETNKYSNKPKEVPNMALEAQIKVATFKNFISNKIQIAKKSQNFREAISDLKKLAIPEAEEFNEERKEVASLIESFTKRIKESEVQARKDIEKKINEHSELTLKLEQSNATIKSLTEKLQKAQVIIEGTKPTVTEDTRAMAKIQESNKLLYSDVQKFKEERRVLKLKTVSLTEKVKKMAKNSNMMLTDVINLSEDRDNLEWDLTNYKKVLSQAEQHIKVCEAELTKRGFKFKEEDEENMDTVNPDGTAIKPEDEGAPVSTEDAPELDAPADDKPAKTASGETVITVKAESKAKRRFGKFKEDAALSDAPKTPIVIDEDETGNDDDNEDDAFQGYDDDEFMVGDDENEGSEATATDSIDLDDMGSTPPAVGGFNTPAKSGIIQPSVDYEFIVGGTVSKNDDFDSDFDDEFGEDDTHEFGDEGYGESPPVSISEATRRSIASYYEQQLKKSPALRDFRKQILESASVIDAIDVVKAIRSRNGKGKNSEVIPTKGGLVEGGWLGKNRI